jgi:hypothetical protein
MVDKKTNVAPHSPRAMGKRIVHIDSCTTNQMNCRWTYPTYPCGDVCPSARRHGRCSLTFFLTFTLKDGKRTFFRPIRNTHEAETPPDAPSSLFSRLHRLMSAFHLFLTRYDLLFTLDIHPNYAVDMHSPRQYQVLGIAISTCSACITLDECAKKTYKIHAQALQYARLCFYDLALRL